MAGRIPQHFIDELLSRTDVVDIVDAYVPLKKGGKNHQACCPFHEEKTPSFTVSQQKQFYHCFGCGANGSAISFLMEYLHMDFVEAIEDLASRAGMEIPREAAVFSQSNNQSSELYELMEMATSFYAKQLRKHSQADSVISYLKGRGISGEIAAEFELGFAPPGWDSLMGELGGSDNASKRLLKIGAVIENDNGGYYDRFRNRLTFPIRDQRGRAIGMGGRVLDDSKPKYLNSPETPIFHKGRELYGLYQARKALKDIGNLFVVEGYMDVIALAQFGIRNAVASLGTAATPEHLEKMFRITNKVVFCFDGDEAGKKAAWRGLENSLPLLKDDKQVYFMFLPEGEDPDTFVRNKGKDAFLDTNLQLPLSEYLFNYLSEGMDLTSPEDQASMAKVTLPFIGKLSSAPALTSILLRKLTGITRIPGDELNQQLEEYRKTGTVNSPLRNVNKQAIRNTGQQSLLTESIKLLLRKPELALDDSLESKLAEIKINGIEFLVEIVKYIQSNPNTTIAGITENYRDREKIRQRLIELAPSESQYAADDNFSDENLRESFLSSLEKLKEKTNQSKLHAFGNLSSTEELTDKMKNELRSLGNNRENSENDSTET
ncbi:MAG TPA: DNA primase [Thiotrichaceae bacterium]|jgi:DNA primase|nr:DNA primase [Thiotrichaceae bacterium]HIM07889.1 DNA primase [Gammaproteobacteria bacterium]